MVVAIFSQVLPQFVDRPQQRAHPESEEGKQDEG